MIATNAPTDDIWEVMETCRAIRYLKPDPIPEAVLDKVLWAATRAPSPGNSQGWDFVVVDDDEAKRVISEAMGAAMLPAISKMQARDRTERLMFDGAAAIIASLATAPTVIFVTGPVIYPAGRPDESFTWSALVSRGAEHPARGASAGTGDGVHDPAPGRRRGDP